MQHTCLLVERLLELVDGRRDTQPALQHRLLTLQAHVARPAHKVRQIAARLDVTTWRPAEELLAWGRRQRQGLLWQTGSVNGMIVCS